MTELRDELDASFVKREGVAQRTDTGVLVHKWDMVRYDSHRCYRVPGNREIRVRETVM